MARSTRTCGVRKYRLPERNNSGNANAASDVEVGLELLRAGLRGARLNVEINLGSVKDSGYVEDVRCEIQQLSESGAEAAPSASS